MDKTNNQAPEVPPEILEIADELLAEERSLDLDNLPADLAPWMQKTIRFIDRLNEKVGNFVSLVTLIIIGSMFYEITARYFFLSPTLWAYDVSRMFYGALFTLGSAFALSRGVHIRADFLYRNWKEKNQALMDLILYVCFYFPGLMAFFVASLIFSIEAWQRGERGMDTAWMPVVYPVKSVLTISIFLLLLQGFSEVLKCWYSYKKGKWISS